MKKIVSLTSMVAWLWALPLVAQHTVPLYTVTVVDRTTDAINYQYRQGPTRIGFRGTVLMPAAKGEATVESQRGRTEIDAKFENVAAPVRYGREYLTYVLWALTPEGAARNLGEVVPTGSDKAHLRVTTDLQAFGLIVTAEPYGAVRQPSNVVVMENEVRADTVGKVQPITVKQALLARGHYTWEVPERLQNAPAVRKISMDEYEAQLHLYEAENAIGIARAAGADEYAADTLAKASRLLSAAQGLPRKGNTKAVVQTAREAAQTAEDARVIAERRGNQARVATAEAAATAARQAQSAAQAEVQRAQAEASAARAQAESERAARERAEADAAAARVRAAQEREMPAAPPPPPSPSPQDQSSLEKRRMRERLLVELNAVLPVRDTPRGLVVTVHRVAPPQIARLVSAVAPYPNLRVAVEGYTEASADPSLGWRNADEVRRALVEQGLPAAQVSARGLGDSRPLVADSNPTAREQNRQVEIVLSGDAIGELALWDRPYRLSMRR